MIEETVEALRKTLEHAGISPTELEAIVDLERRSPEQTSIAVIGPQNAGKSTLIAVLTGSREALADVGPTIATQTSHGYLYERNGTRFQLWDTPGLGTELDEHDAEARDRITRADAVLVAMSSDLLSEEGQSQLAELLQVGRKRGAVLPVITKADREELANRAGIAVAVKATLPEVDREPLFVAARDVLDAAKAGEEPPIAAGISELQVDLEALALGEARRRLKLTAAVRLVELLETAEGGISAEEPEVQRAHLFQRRIGRTLLRAQRRMQGAVEASERRARLAALRTTSEIAIALDERSSKEVMEVVSEEAWDRFVAALAEVESSLIVTIGEELETAAQELRRLDQGELAEHLRDVAAGVGVDGPERPGTSSADDAATAQRVLDFAGRAAGIIKKIPVRRAGVAGAVLGVAVDLGEVFLDVKVAQAIDEAKIQIRSEYLERAEAHAEDLRSWYEEAESDTIGHALARCSAIEDELFASLSGLRETLENVAGRRRVLDDYITAELRAGFERSTV